MQCKSMLQVNWGRKSFILLSSDRAYLEKQRDAKAEEEERELRGSVGFKQTGSYDVIMSEGTHVYTFYEGPHLWKEPASMAF